MCIYTYFSRAVCVLLLVPDSNTSEPNSLISPDTFMHGRATLDAYSKRKRGQARSQYAEVYPVMVSLLKRGLEVGREGEGERGK